MRRKIKQIFNINCIFYGGMFLLFSMVQTYFYSQLLEAIGGEYKWTILALEFFCYVSFAMLSGFLETFVKNYKKSKEQKE